VKTLYGPPAATLALLIHDRDSQDFLNPALLLKDITANQAFRSLGLPYTIASLVAHMDANLVYNIRLLRDGHHETLHLWPQVETQDWESLKSGFLEHLETLEHLAFELDLNQIVFTQTETEPAWTIGYKLAASVAKHTAYHLGQIALLKRLVHL
jgi:hypothetical protein